MQMNELNLNLTGVMLHISLSTSFEQNWKITPQYSMHSKINGAEQLALHRTGTTAGARECRGCYKGY
jgi:hypothetical protein